MITCELLLKAILSISSISSLSFANPDPNPPKANELLINKGNPISLLNSKASETFDTTLLGAVYSPISSSIFLNLSRSSASITVSSDEPKILMFSRWPCSYNNTPQFKAV